MERIVHKISMAEVNTEIELEETGTGIFVELIAEEPFIRR